MSDIAEAIDFSLAEVPAMGNRLFHRLAKMRAESPIFWSARNGAWIVTGHAAVDDGLKNKLPLSAVRMPDLIVRQIPPEERPNRIPYLMQTVRHWVMNNDPPDHSRLRRLIMPAFSKPLADAQRPYARAIVREVLGRLGDGKQDVELVSQVAREIPQRMILRLFGLPETYRDRMSRWVATTTQTFGNAQVSPETLDLCEAVLLEMRSCLLEEIERRRDRPTDDFISALVAARDEGDRLTEEEMLAICFVTLLGGFNTTANTIALGTAALAVHPDICARLQSDPAAIEPALMELMRYIAMSTTVPRIALADFDWDGHAIRKGQYVFLMLAGANRDETVFKEPDKLDLDRPQAKNLAFAPGLHFCIGHYFAKMQLAEFFTELLDRYDLALHDEPLRFGPALAFRGVERLDITLSPRRTVPTNLTAPPDQAAA
jgi:cytochrome P450